MAARPLEPITSTKNPLVRRCLAVREGEEPGLVPAEGVRLVEEALEAGRRIVEALVSPRLEQGERGRALRARLEGSGTRVVACSDRVLERASALTTHQGVLALVERPEWSDAELLRGEAPVLVVAAGIRDPGNLGAVVRAAEAAEAAGLVALRGSADPFRDKAVRASSGSIFRLPTRGNVEPAELLELLGSRGIPLVASDRARGKDLWDADLSPPLALVVGSEAQGVPQSLMTDCQRLVRIPMAGAVESLNVAVAAALVLYEILRRRR